MGIGIINVSDEQVKKIKEKVINEEGQLIPMPATFYKQFTQEEISRFCVQEGYYSLPTNELIDWLRAEMGEEKRVIEIASGNGVYGRELGITATDSYLQKLNMQVKLRCESLGQTAVPYGKDVKPLEALEAVRKYKPSVVLVAWGTHKYNPKKPAEEGNQFGIDFKKIMDYRSVKKVILIGDLNIHKFNPIVKESTRVIQEDWIVSRSMQGENAIIVYEK